MSHEANRGLSISSALKKAERYVNRSRTPEGFLRFEISSPEAIKRALKIPDLMAEGAKPHVVNFIKKRLIERLPELHMGEIWEVRGKPIVKAKDNFDRLLFPKDNPGRSSTYTRYVDGDHVLRTHTSAHIPETLKEFRKGNPGEISDTIFVLPGLVYRRDVIDKNHLDVFHQIDVWTLRENGDRGSATEEDLHSLINLIFDTVLPGKTPIMYKVDHPYTVKGVEVYADFDGSELEVLEAGLIHPDILRNAGFDPKKYSGLALGMGVDRLAMLLKKLKDIRYLRSNDTKIASQMLDLTPFKEVSNQPPIARDMSFCIPANYTEEDISEEIKEAFGKDSPLVEEVIIKSRTKFNDLPPVAVERLGAQKDQDNVLVRIVLRHPDRSITRKQADELYDAAYPKLHKGVKGYTR